MEIKRVLITGASSGLGAALAEAYWKEGWVVYGIARREMPEYVKPIQVDITEHAEVVSQLATVLGNKQLDLCILNAGILGPVDKLPRIALAELEDTILTNCTSNKPILDYILNYSNVKSIVSISSGAALKAYEGWGAYCISKAALEMMMMVYQEENPHVKFCSLAPGLVKSPMQDYIKTLDAKKLPGMKKFHDAYDTMPTPEKVAANILSHMDQIEGAGRVDLRDILATHENV